MADILEKSVEYLKEPLEKIKTFKVEAKRADKRFPLTSPEICREVGGMLLSKYHHLKVDVHNPDITVFVEIRDTNAYVRAERSQAISSPRMTQSPHSLAVVTRRPVPLASTLAIPGSWALSPHSTMPVVDTSALSSGGAASSVTVAGAGASNGAISFGAGRATNGVAPNTLVSGSS